MVSLSNDSTRQGAYFFDQQNDQLNQSQDDDDLLLAHNWSGDEEPKFHKVKTVPVSYCQVFLLMCYEMLLFLVPYGLEKRLNLDDKKSFSILVYSHLLLWLIVGVITYYSQHQHEVMKKNGYVEFYSTIKTIHKIPFHTLCVGNALSLLLAMLATDLELYKKKEVLEPVMFLELILTLEWLIAVCCTIKYISMVRAFNRAKPAPDVEQEEVMTLLTQAHMHRHEVGFRDGDYHDNLLEKQGDMIRYLKEHNECLSKRIMTIKTSTHAELLSSMSR
ncbi:transmembrane protein 192-like [Anneissia japonica]|uniref:transmembrane protein 192-like n=1 Tax=Anneissia japonica TaxID=1529436 RepID=UPI00142598AB|nr:transmembrane protein 192-like [Anneissia japonica]